MTPEFAGAVLAGGASRRMGTDKAFVTVDGQPMVVRTAEALATAGADPVIVVGGDSARIRDLGLAYLPDRAPGQGPLHAVLTALAHLETADLVVVLACDLLAPDPATIIALVSVLNDAPESAAAVPIIDGQAQWAHAAWRRSSAEGPMQTAAARGERSLRRSLDPRLIVEVEGLDRSALADADRPDDLPAGRASVEDDPVTG